MVVNGYGGLDELTSTGPNRISYLQEDGSITHLDIDPTELGFHMATYSTISRATTRPPTPPSCAAHFLDGRRIPDPSAMSYCLNAGAQRSWPRAASFNRRWHRHCARDSLDSGMRACKSWTNLIEIEPKSGLMSQCSSSPPTRSSTGSSPAKWRSLPPAGVLSQARLAEMRAARGRRA